MNIFKRIISSKIWKVNILVLFLLPTASLYATENRTTMNVTSNYGNLTITNIVRSTSATLNNGKNYTATLNTTSYAFNTPDGSTSLLANAGVGGDVYGIDLQLPDGKFSLIYTHDQVIVTSDFITLAELDQINAKLQRLDEKDHIPFIISQIARRLSDQTAGAITLMNNALTEHLNNTYAIANQGLAGPQINGFGEFAGCAAALIGVDIAAIAAVEACGICAVAPAVVAPCITCAVSAGAGLAALLAAFSACEDFLYADNYPGGGSGGGSSGGSVGGSGGGFGIIGGGLGGGGSSGGGETTCEMVGTVFVCTHHIIP